MRAAKPADFSLMRWNCPIGSNVEWLPKAEVDVMDEDRIERIARAMCRAARMDPDKPAPQGPYTMMLQYPGTAVAPANWTLFRRQAELFCATNRDMRTDGDGLSAVSARVDSTSPQVAKAAH